MNDMSPLLTDCILLADILASGGDIIALLGSIRSAVDYLV